MKRNKELLQWYQFGFDNELKNKFTKGLDFLELCKKAYCLGAVHAIIGDDVTSIDDLSDEEILKMIK